MAKFPIKKMQELRWAGHGSDWPEGFRPCMKCEEMKPVAEFHKHKACRGGVNSVCKGCRRPLSAENYTRHTPQYKLWYRAKRRAKERGQAFGIALEDVVVPDMCPVFLVPFEENTPYSASLDRIDSSQGYIKGNVQVISTRANILKNNVTLEALERMVAYMRKSVCEVL